MPWRCRLAVRRPSVEARSPRRQQHREQGEGGDDGDERDEQAAVAEAAQEREGHRDEGEEADRHRHAAEDHRPSGGGHGHDDGLVVGAAPVAFLAPAGDDEQRIVDGDAEADQGDEVLDQLADLGDRGDGPEEQEGAEDRHRSHDERDHGQERSEDEDQARRGRRWRRCTTSPSTPIPPLPGAFCRSLRLVAATVTPVGARARSRAAELDRGRRVVAGEHQPESGVPVRGDQAGVVHRRVGHDTERSVRRRARRTSRASAARPAGLSTRSVPGKVTTATIGVLLPPLP